MAVQFDVSTYLKRIDSHIMLSELYCPACGSTPYVVSSQDSTFCTFCEYFAVPKKDASHRDAQVAKNLAGMYSSAEKGQWQQGAQYADALAATKDPQLLYGASQFYRFFSDFTYHDVNYNLGGFMYSNADKRSDEPLKNKYNAMALISKSKEYIFKALKLLSSMPADESTLYLKFLCNMKLKRHFEAGSAVVGLRNAKAGETLWAYANTVFAIESSGKMGKANRLPDPSFASGSANFFYYTAKHLAKSGNLEVSIQMLSSLNEAAFIPMASSYLARVEDVSSSLHF